MRTIDEIKNISMEEVNNMSQDELRSLVNDTTKKVNRRISHLTNYFKKNKLPLPTAFRDWNLTLRAENKLLQAGMITKDQLKNTTRLLRSDATRLRKQFHAKKDEDVKIKSKRGISYATLNYNTPENASISQMRYYFKVMKQFLNSKQGTVTGYKKSMSSFYKKLAGEFDFEGKKYFLSENKIKNMSKVKYKKFWSVYNKIQEVHPSSVSFNLGSSELQRQIYYMKEEMKLSFDDIEKILLNQDEKYINTSQEVESSIDLEY